MKIVEPSVELLWSTPEAEKMIETAGRTCYKSEPKVFQDCKTCRGLGKVWSEIACNNQVLSHKVELDCEECSNRSSREFISKVIKSGHESVLEHASASLRIITDRGVTHEFCRHRIGFSYSQESSRYCNYSGDKFGNEITVILPYNIPKLKEDGYQSEEYLLWWGAMHNSEIAYLRMIEQKISPQVARSVLPTCLKTEIVVTANVRAWRNFLKLRLTSKAHPDMIVIAMLIYGILNKEFPNCFKDIFYK